MKTRDWKDAAELIGIAAIVASLIFVGLQMQQAQEIANADRRMMFVANTIELHNAINENADIWARGKAGEDLDEIEVIVFDRLMSSMNDFFYFSSRAATGVGNEYGAQSTIHKFAVFLHRNPGARRAWSSEKQNWDRWKRLLMADRDNPGINWVEVIEADWAILDQAPD